MEVKEITIDNLRELSRKNCVRFALFCANQVAHIETSEKAQECRDIVERWLEGKASSKECRDAANAACDTSIAVARATAVYAIYTTYAAGTTRDHFAHFAYYAYHASYAADAASNKKTEEIIEEQRNYYDALLSWNEIFEEIVLDGK